MKEKPFIAITSGDPLGIGSEVTVKALKNKAVLAACRPVVIGGLPALKKYGFDDKKFLFIDTSFHKINLSKHLPSKEGGLESFKAVKTAAVLALKGKVKAVVTAPVSKQSWQLAGVPFTGHTEFFKARASSKNQALMMFSCGPLNAASVTEHYALKDVSALLTKEKIVNAALLFDEALKNAGFKKPRVALAALNPHAGDGGKLGREEQDILLPAVKALRGKNIDISGPLPVDSVWLKHKNGQFDGVLFMYHDAALLGLKLACAAQPVHITAGLDIVRTSPVHGTAFDIAGKNKADESGMAAAVLQAAKLVRQAL